MNVPTESNLLQEGRSHQLFYCLDQRFSKFLLLKKRT